MDELPFVVSQSPAPRLRVGPVELGPAGAQPPLPPGRTHTEGGVRLLALPRPGGLPAIVAGTGGRTVLWAPGVGPLGPDVVEALAGAVLDGAVLGTASVALAGELAGLRRVWALRAGADVLTLGAAGRPDLPGRSPVWLPAWGVRAAAPGTEVQVGGAAPEPPRRTLVLGPAASGKSALAEELLAAEPQVVYAAPGPAPAADDPDWAARIARHQDRRPPWWDTVEDAAVPDLLASPGPPVLVDSLGSWVTAALTRSGTWNDEPGWSLRYDTEVDAMGRAWRTGTRRVVLVAEETGWGVVPATSAGRAFRDALGELARRLAQDAEQVLLVVAGRVLQL